MKGECSSVPNNPAPDATPSPAPDATPSPAPRAKNGASKSTMSQSAVAFTTAILLSLQCL